MPSDTGCDASAIAANQVSQLVKQSFPARRQPMTRQDFSFPLSEMKETPTTTETLLVKNLDVRVLAVLGELRRTANVSHAAQNLGFSQ